MSTTHVWVKDAEDPDTQAARRAELEQMRRRVLSGASFTAAWSALGVDGGLHLFRILARDASP